MKLKAVSPYFRFAKEYGSVCWVKITIWFCFFLDQESPLFYKQCNASDVEDSKATGHRMITALSVSKSQSSLRLQQTSVTQWPLPIRYCPVPVFVVYVDYNVSWCMINLLEQFLVFSSTWDGAGTYARRSFSPLSVTAASSSHYRELGMLWTQWENSYFGIRSNPVITQQHVKIPVILPKMQVAGYS